MRFIIYILIKRKVGINRFGCLLFAFVMLCSINIICSYSYAYEEMLPNDNEVQNTSQPLEGETMTPPTTTTDTPVVIETTEPQQGTVEPTDAGNISTTPSTDISGNQNTSEPSNNSSVSTTTEGNATPDNNMSSNNNAIGDNISSTSSNNVSSNNVASNKNSATVTPQQGAGQNKTNPTATTTKRPTTASPVTNQGQQTLTENITTVNTCSVFFYNSLGWEFVEAERYDSSGNIIIDDTPTHFTRATDINETNNESNDIWITGTFENVFSVILKNNEGTMTNKVDISALQSIWLVPANIMEDDTIELLVFDSKPSNEVMQEAYGIDDLKTSDVINNIIKKDESKEYSSDAKFLGKDYNNNTKEKIITICVTAMLVVGGVIVYFVNKKTNFIYKMQHNKFFHEHLYED